MRKTSSHEAEWREYRSSLKARIEKGRIAARVTAHEDEPLLFEARLRQELVAHLSAAGDSSRWYDRTGETPKFIDTPEWTDAIRAAASTWRSYYSIAGLGPMVTEGAGHQASRLLFGFALEGCERDELIVRVDDALDDLTKIGGEVGFAPMHGLDDTTAGLTSYFECMAMAVHRWRGELPAGMPLDLRILVAPHRPKRGRRPVWDLTLDHSTMTLSHGAEVCALGSTVRVTMVQALADAHGRMTGPQLRALTRCGSVRNIIFGLRRLPGFPEIIDSSPKGYWLKPGVRISPTQPRPFDLP